MRRENPIAMLACLPAQHRQERFPVDVLRGRPAAHLDQRRQDVDRVVDLKFQVQCPVSKIVGPAAGGAAAAKLAGMIKLAPEQELVLLGTVRGKYEMDALQVPIRPIHFTVSGGQQHQGVIGWKPKSIQFTMLKPAA